MIGFGSVYAAKKTIFHICLSVFSKAVHLVYVGAYTENETGIGGVAMCQIKLRKLIGLSAMCFGAGILLSFLLPGYILAFLEALVVIAAGVLLLGKRC